MIMRKSTIIISSALKQRLCFVAATLDSLVKPEPKLFSTKVSHEVFDSGQFFNSDFDTSVKSYINRSKIDLLNKFLHPVKGLTCNYNFVIDEAVAKDIVDKILSRSHIKKSIIVEGNPGLGLVTLNLIKSNVPYLIVCDSSVLPCLSLQQIIEKHPGKIKLRKTDFNSRSFSLIVSLCDEAEKQNQTVTLIGTITSFYFIRLLVLTCLKNALWRSEFEIYLILNSLVKKSILNYYPEYLKFLYYCSFNLFFTIEEMANYPKSAFLPIIKEEESEFSLVRISKNPNLFKHINEEEIVDYINFITILGRSANNLIIQTLEKWLPDCGPYLIQKGISMRNTTRDLSHQESIMLFNFFKECEGYSHFKLCARHAFKNYWITN